MKSNDEKIRQNWAEALKNVEHGSDLSSEIGFGFKKQDLLMLCNLHEANLFREKIDDLLEDCNFHRESSLMIEGKYDECRQMIIDEYIGF